MKKRLFIVLFVMLVALLTGCMAHSSELPVATAVLLGNHKCGKKIDTNNAIIRDNISESVSTYGYISIIAVDGEPNIVAKGNCDINAQYKKADPQKLAADATARTLTILESLDAIYADSPEVDTLEAIRLAVSSLNEAPTNSVKKIVILDSGVCTTGLCDFHNNIMSADAVAVADALEELEAIPNLQGIHVTWLYLGEVEEPQESLSPKQINKLKSIWKEIIERGGGTFEYVDVPANEEKQSADLPSVTPVDVEKEVPISFDPKALSEDVNLFEEPQFLREEQVCFVPDSDTLVDPDGAQKILEPIAEYMLKHPDFRLLLVGTTAGDGAGDYSISLSNSRATRIKQVLVEKGVEEGRIDTLGMGGTDPWHIYNVGTSGELAKQNRKCVLLDADSAIAKELMP